MTEKIRLQGVEIFFRLFTRVMCAGKLVHPFRNSALLIRFNRSGAFGAAREKLSQPIKTSAATSLSTFHALFVGEVRCDAVERFAMHRFRAQLHFQRASVAGVDG